ncbi:hypothetical protein CgunFtcFv8_011422 [Champsocephalus gunnari]|uniref:Uncharacterized protein n=1 Tax=Champsocephalus gunnari TaxID=52237 RepID=A0AAN8D6T0_CHAGU|nr:hypothetical protein CgunFtcFv8_011422 [Champsocephalus gunnari]
MLTVCQHYIRSQSQIRSDTPAVSGARHVMDLIASSSSATCLTCR